MNKTKMVIVMRNDLNMRKGKMISQGSHASLKLILDLMRVDHYLTTDPFDKYNLLDYYTYIMEFNKGSILDNWLNGIFTKIVVQVNSEEELLEIYINAKENNLLATMIEDCGLTEFNNISTKTCCAILGWNEEVDLLQGIRMTADYYLANPEFLE